MRNGAMITVLLALLGAPMLEAQERSAQERPERRAREEAGGRGWLGIVYGAVEGAEGERIVIERVLPGSPAERAGVMVGDTVVRWDGRADVTRAVTESPPRPGQTVRVRVRRAGERDRDLAVVAGERPRELVEVRRGPDDVIVLRPGAVVEALRINSDSLRIRLDSLAVHADSLHRRLRVVLRDSLGPRLRELEREIPEVSVRIRRATDGVRAIELEPLLLDLDLGARSVAGAEFAEINEGLSDYFGVERGVVVLRVAPSTPAARAGLQAGDVIVEANGSAVQDVRSLRQAVTRARQRTVELEVVRKGQRRVLEMRWE